MALAKEDIENRLIQEEPPKGKAKRNAQEKKLQDNLSELELDLMLASDGIDFGEDGLFSVPQPVVKTLSGEDAAKFLGVPFRKHGILQRGDYSRIYKKFKPLITQYIGEGRSPKKLFWDNIKIRVWKKKNIGKMTGKGTLSATKPCKYSGDIFTGKALSIYLSEVEHSTRSMDYIVQLLEVNVTEDMESV